MKIFTLTGRVVLPALLFFCLAAGPAAAAPEAEAGRAIFGRWQESVINLKLTTITRVSVSGREMDRSEATREIAATIVDPSGLAVFSLGAASPEEAFLSMMGAGAEVETESEVTALTMRLPDGRELPAMVAARDRDLDLGFARPLEAPEEPFFALDLSNPASAQILERIFVLGRLGGEAGRVAAIVPDRVSALVERPRRFYIPAYTAYALGCPVFNDAGDPVGILLLRESPAAATGDQRFLDSLFGGMTSTGVFPVVVPAGEISTALEQARSVE